MNSMQYRIAFLWPEIALFIATCIVMVVGLSPALKTRKLSAIIAGLGVAVAGFLATMTPVAKDPHAGQLLLPAMVPYAKTLIACLGLLLLLLLAGTVDR